MSTSHKSINSLMKHMRTTSGMRIAGSRHKRELERIGYFHGYKGYRFCRKPHLRIPYATFDELLAIVRFDTALKALLFPHLMIIEMATKNLTLLHLMEHANSGQLQNVHAQLLALDARDRQAMVHNHNSVLLEAYQRYDAAVSHYFDRGETPATMPTWALLEILSLGKFARLLACLDQTTKAGVATQWGMRRDEVDVPERIVFMLSDLRNAVAHNNIIFDTRFRKRRASRALKAFAKRRLNLPQAINVTYKTITDYVVLIALVERSLGYGVVQCRSLLNEYRDLLDELDEKVPADITSCIAHTDVALKLARASQWISRPVV